MASHYALDYSLFLEADVGFEVLVIFKSAPYNTHGTSMLGLKLSLVPTKLYACKHTFLLILIDFIDLLTIAFELAAIS